MELSFAFIDGDVDLITMHASDTIVNLVADGHGENPQPWARNDLVVVGPASDPVGIRGQTDAVAALGRPLDQQEGPYRLVIPDEKRHILWVRMLQSLRVTRLSADSLVSDEGNLVRTRIAV